MEENLSIENGLADLSTERLLAEESSANQNDARINVAAINSRFNIGDDIILMMEISQDKNWVFCVHRSRHNEDQDIRITRYPFEAYNVETKKIERVATVNSIDGAVAIPVPYDQATPSLIITDHYSEYKNNAKFLSISPDGKYIALSCYEDPDNQPGDRGFSEKEIPRCVIFEVKDASIVLYKKLKKCNGRAVFFNRENNAPCLAVVDLEYLAVYNNFSKLIEKPTYFFEFVDTTRWRNISQRDLESFISAENASWADLEVGSHNLRALNSLMALSNQIRHGVLLTRLDTIIKLWSIIDHGVCLTSFEAPKEQVIALSKDLKYAATIKENTMVINIYYAECGLLAYTLQSRYGDSDSFTKVTHARFCYESRYLALSGFRKKKGADGICTTEVIFEIWFIEGERTIYGKILNSGGKYDDKSKIVKPLIYKSITQDGRKCLKGLYTHIEGNKSKTICLELKIDEELKNSDQVKPVWLNDSIPCKKDIYEIINDIDDHKHLKCAKIIAGSKEYLVRFGKCMVQLWVEGNPGASNVQEKEDQLVYIRAYKGPSYGLAYSFRDTWEILNFDTIKFMKEEPIGRVILNIMQSSYSLSGQRKIVPEGVYHTEEIFLPISNDGRTAASEFDSHTLESACQALHYLHSVWNANELMTRISVWIKDEETCIGETRHAALLKYFSKRYKEEAILRYENEARFKEKLTILLEKTQLLINKAITQNKFGNSKYFATEAGSRTLAMLASFDRGTEIIKLVLKSEVSIPIGVFSYYATLYESCLIDVEENCPKSPVLVRMIERANSTEARFDVVDYRNSPKVYQCIIAKLSFIPQKENFLTILIRNLNYNLYRLMFNRILSDSKKIRPGNWPALIDTLLFLQDENTGVNVNLVDLLLTSSQKLSYLAFDDPSLGISDQRDLGSTYRCMSGEEQLKKCKPNWWNPINPLENKLSWFIKNLYELLRFHYAPVLKKKFTVSKKNSPKDRIRYCVAPFPYFNTYDVLIQSRHQSIVRIDNKSIKRRRILEVARDVEIYKKKSLFVTVASDQNSNNIFKQGDTVLEVMLYYKWKKFLRLRFIGICLIHATYYISYCTGVLFALELYGYNSASSSIHNHPGHLVSIIIMFLSGAVLFIQEARQIYNSAKFVDYLSSGYNWVDLAAFIFPLMTFLQLIRNWNGYYELCSITTLVLWLHGILRLRVISFVGIALETIIQLIQKVWSILFILLLVTFAFTHSFMVLLRQRDDQFFQENYIGSTSLASNNSNITTIVGNTTLYDISSSNGFKDPFKAFYQVWLFIFGVWDPIKDGNAGDDRMIFALCILFALITVLIFTNMVIALMSSTVDEVKAQGKRVWVSHFATVVAEIEQYWCSASTKHNRNNNPSNIYYVATNEEVQKHEEKLERETEELQRKVLGIGNRCACHP